MAAIPSLEEVFSRCRVAESDLQCAYPYELRINVAKRLTNWREFGYSAGIPREKIEAIERDQPSEEVKRIIALDTWHQLHGSAATCLKLVKALFASDRVDLAEEVCRGVAAEKATPSSESALPRGEEEEENSASGRQMAQIVCNIFRLHSMRFKFLSNLH